MTKSEHLFQRALQCIPGGVNSPVRAWGAVGGDPAFIARAQGSQIWDEDGHQYTDYLASWGPMILGHAAPPVIAALQAALSRGTSFGASTEAEVEMAETLCRAIPSIEKVRLVSSGTEATMSAIRLARGATGRSKIIKFDGCYHGHVDSLLVRAGSGAATFGVPDSAGVPEAVASQTLVARHNQLEDVRAYLQSDGDDIAAVVVEPVAGNMGLIPPPDGFLAALREVTERAGSLLIFDEVITGFRLCYGGYQNLVDVQPDLTCLGKIVGGGLPMAAFGGRRDLMNQLSPLGPVYQAGTLSGNPLAVSAGLATLRELRKPGVYETLDTSGARLEAGMRAALRDFGKPATFHRLGSMFALFLGVDEVPDAARAGEADKELYARWFRGMLQRKTYLAPSAFETGFVSLAHSEEEIDTTIEAAREVLAEIG